MRKARLVGFKQRSHRRAIAGSTSATELWGQGTKLSRVAGDWVSDTGHTVGSRGCSCKGFEYRGTCKHWRAVEDHKANLKAWKERAKKLKNKSIADRRGLACNLK